MYTVDYIKLPLCTLRNVAVDVGFGVEVDKLRFMAAPVH